MSNSGEVRIKAYCDYGWWKRGTNGKRQSGCNNEAAMIVGYVSDGRCVSARGVCLDHSDTAFVNSFSGAVIASLALDRWDWFDHKIVDGWHSALVQMAQARKEDEEQEIDGLGVGPTWRERIEAVTAAGKEAMVEMVAVVYRDMSRTAEKEE